LLVLLFAILNQLNRIVFLFVCLFVVCFVFVREQGNNGLSELPVDIGRMTRLTLLNVADNNLKNLPMSIGLCQVRNFRFLHLLMQLKLSLCICRQGLDNLGSGYNIDRNPIQDEKILAKFQVGTDHLCQYMASRLQAWEAHLVREGKGQTVLSPWRAPYDKPSANSSSSSNGSGVKAAPGKQLSAAAAGANAAAAAAGRDVPRASVRAPNSEADKIGVLCNWAGRELQSRVKPKLRELTAALDATTDIAVAAPLAKNIRALRQAVELYCELMSPFPKSPAPDMLGISDKLKVRRALFLFLFLFLFFFAFFWFRFLFC
jgi:hypothetical protein